MLSKQMFILSITFVLLGSIQIIVNLMEQKNLIESWMGGVSLMIGIYYLTNSFRK